MMSLPRRTVAAGPFETGRCRRPAFPAAAALFVMLGLALGIVPVEATCEFSQPAWHDLGGWFGSCADGVPVGGYMFLLADPAISSVTNDPSIVSRFVCRASDAVTEQLQCQLEAQSVGDERVTIAFDWGGPLTGPGCPNPGSVGPNGSSRIAIHVVTATGWSVLTSLGFSVGTNSAGQPRSNTNSCP